VRRALIERRTTETQILLAILASQEYAARSSPTFRIT